MEKVVVVGGGLMGSAAAWQLARAGADVLLLEQQDSVYTYGSSFGDARISRSLGPQDDLFSWLQQQSVSETQELLAFLNEQQGHGSHSMESIYTTSPVTYLFYDSQDTTIEALLNGQSDPHEVARGSQAVREAFGMEVSDSMTVIREFKPYSGTLNPIKLISKLHQGTIKAGGRIRYGTWVTSLKKENGHFTLKIEDPQSGGESILKAEKVVSAAGPYTGALLKSVAPYMEDLIHPKRLFLAFFQPKPASWKALGAAGQKRILEHYPVADLDKDLFYSMIEKHESGVPVFKVGGHFLRSPITSLDSVWTLPLSNDEIRWARERTLGYWEILGVQLDGDSLEYHSGYSCVYSLTESEVPLVTPAIDHNGKVDDGLVVIGGLSGVGAKGALAYGKLAADLILNRPEDGPMYQKATRMMGLKRLQEDLTKLQKQQARKVANIESVDGRLLFRNGDAFEKP